MKIKLKNNEDGYDVVSDIIRKHADENFIDYYRHEFLAFIQLDDNPPWITKEFFTHDGDSVLWDMDWWEGQEEFELLGYTCIEDIEEPEVKL